MSATLVMRGKLESHANQTKSIQSIKFEVFYLMSRMVTHSRGQQRVAKRVWLPRLSIGQLNEAI